MRLPPGSPLFLIFAAAPAAATLSDVTPPELANRDNVHSVSWVDVDGDGDDDLFTCVRDGPGNRLYRNDGGVFVEVPGGRLANPGPFQGGAAWGDYDADGDPDVFLLAELTGAASVLLRNDGAAGFEDVTSPALEHHGYAPTWVDYNGDGHLDLSSTGPDGSHLFRNEGDGTFTDVTVSASRDGTVLATPGYGLAWGDADGDGFADLYIGSLGGSDAALALNFGDGTFANVASGDLVDRSGAGFSVNWEDFDGDLDLDLFVLHLDSPSLLLRNDGLLNFVDVTAGELAVARTAYTSAAADFDLDGDVDLFLGGRSGEPSVLLENDGTGGFTDAAAVPATVDRCWGAATSDWNGDGLPDLHVGQSDVVPTADVLLRNDFATSSHWLGFELTGGVSNRESVGARIEVWAGGWSGVREQTRGGGWVSQRSRIVHFGLGAETRADSVRIRWPSGMTQVLTDVDADRIVRVVEPELVAEIQAYPPGSAFEFRMDLRGMPVTGVRLRYRVSGSRSGFTSANATISGGDAVLTMNANDATTRGIQYFTEFQLGGTPVTSPREGFRAARFLPARLDGERLPAVPPAGEYMLFGLPVASPETSVEAVLEDDLGPPDPARWRFGRWDPGADAYLAHPVDDLQIVPGHGFWLGMQSPIPVGHSGLSVDPLGVPVELQPGWNMVGNPFLFPVTRLTIDFSGAPSVENRLVGYVPGVGYEARGQLDPWNAYWMHNAGAGPETIVIVGREPLQQRGSEPETPIDWQVEVVARQGKLRDGGNRLGLAPGSEPRLDALDWREPPGLPGLVRAWFELADAWDRRHEVTRDLRPALGAGQSWTLVVSAEPEEPVTLELDGVDSLPGHVRAVIVAEGTWTPTDLRERSTFLLPPGEHRFRVAIGSEDYTEAIAHEPPFRFELYAPVPNPFRDSARIGFALPRATAIDLTIHDVAGRRVRSVMSGTLGAGRHFASWSGRDDRGRLTAPGVYFLRLSGDGRSETRKIVRR